MCTHVLPHKHELLVDKLHVIDMTGLITEKREVDASAIVRMLYSILDAKNAVGLSIQELLIEVG
jgi:hypothetical protein